MFTHNIYFESCIWIAHAATILILAIYLYKSLQNRARNYTTTIILIFNFLFILYPISLLLFSWLEHIIYHLTIYWATALALFTYGVLNASGPFPFRSFMVKSIIICLLLSILSFYAYNSIEKIWLNFFFRIDRNFSEKSYLSLLLDLMSTSVPIILIFVYYSRAYQIIISGRLGSSVFANASASKILWYSRITLICHSPKIITDILLIIDLIRGKSGDGWSKFFVGEELKKVFDSVWALLNLWVDWSVRAERERFITRISLENERSMSWLVDQEDEQKEES